MDVDVSHLDVSEHCQCENCRKAFAVDRGQVGPILNFTNAIADAVAEISPDIYVSMLAYAGAYSPPAKTLPRENVAVSYCFYVGDNKVPCFNHSYSAEDCMNGKGILFP